MLYSVVLGEPEKITNEWSLVEDKYGNKFISNDSIRGKIRLGKSVEEKLERKFTGTLVASDNSDEGDLGTECGYEVAEDVFLSNNNKNMNLTYLKYNPDNGKAHKDDDVLFLTLSQDTYTLYTYNTFDNSIIQTYKRKDQFNGCVIKFQTNEGEVKKVIHLGVYNKQTEKFNTIDISVDDDGTNVEIHDHVEKEEYDKLRAIAGKKKWGSLFRIRVPQNSLVTNTYIVKEKYVPFIETATEKIKNAEIFSVDDESTLNVAEFKRDFSEYVEKNRIRMVTFIGLYAPKDFAREYKFLYMFNIDPEKIDDDGNFRVNCIKSN